VDVAASRPWNKHPDSLAADEVLCGDDEGKWMWKLDGMNGKGKGWMGTGNLVENPRCQRLHFEVKMHQKTLLAAGLRPEPPEEHSASPESLTAIDCHGMEHTLAGIRGAVWLGLIGKSSVGGWGGMRWENRGAGEKMYSNPPLEETSYSVKNVPKCLAAGLCPDPLGELEPPFPPKAP